MSETALQKKERLTKAVAEFRRRGDVSRSPVGTARRALQKAQDRENAFKDSKGVTMANTGGFIPSLENQSLKKLRIARQAAEKTFLAAVKKARADK